MATIGIDLSLTSPCVAIVGGDNNTLLTVFFYPQRKREVGRKFEPISFSYLGEKYLLQLKLLSDQPPDKKKYGELQRVGKITKDIVRNLNAHTHGRIDSVQMEGYAIASVSSSKYQLHELGGALKFALNETLKGFSPDKLRIVAPTSLKKKWAGSGRAQKGDMFQTWLESTGIDLMKVFGFVFNKNDKIPKPVEDIVDASALALTTKKKKNDHSETTTTTVGKKRKKRCGSSVAVASEAKTGPIARKRQSRVHEDHHQTSSP